MRGFTKFVLVGILSSLSGFAAATGSLLTVEQVVAGLEANVAGLDSMECLIRVHVRNRGAHGKMLQEFTEHRHFWCDKDKRLVRDKHEEDGADDDVLWDGVRQKVRRRRSGKVVEEDFPPTILKIEDVWPSPNYCYFPRLLIDGFTWMVAREGSHRVRLIGRLKDFSVEQLGEQRVEIDVDQNRNVMLQVRAYHRDGTLAERVRMKNFKKVNGMWLPTQILERRNRARNVVDVALEFSVINTGPIDDSVWQLE